MNSTMTRKLVMDAFNAAILKDNPEEGFIFHSDRGVQYASYDYQDLLRESGCKQSMSAKGVIQRNLEKNVDSICLTFSEHSITDQFKESRDGIGIKI